MPAHARPHPESAAAAAAAAAARGKAVLSLAGGGEGGVVLGLHLRLNDGLLLELQLGVHALVAVAAVLGRVPCGLESWRLVGVGGWFCDNSFEVRWGGQGALGEFTN